MALERLQHYDQEELKALLSEGLAKDAAAREEFLAQVRASQPEMASELQRLLEATGKCFLNEQICRKPTVPHSPHPATAPEFVGAYRLVRELGRGGMATVYLARRADGAFDNPVAVKILDTAGAPPESQARFRREWRIQAALEHPNIVRLLDVGVCDGLLYLAMEHVDGQPIDVHCKAHNLSIRSRIELFRRVCEAVSYAHRRLVIHRDIKPSNILVTSSGAPKVIDFGISGLLGGQSSADTIANPRFTPRYASPEQMAGEQIVATSSDVYSLGVVLYELLTEQSAYGSAAVDAGGPSLWAAVMTGAIRRPRALRRDIDRDLEAILMHALQLEPEHRYGSVDEFAADLDAYLSARPVLARGKSRWYRAITLSRRYWKQLLAAAILLAALVGLAFEARRNADRAERRYNDVRSLSDSVLRSVTERVWAMPGGVSTVKYIAENQVRYTRSLLVDAPGDRTLRRDLLRGLWTLGTVQGYPVSENLGDTESATLTFRQALAEAEGLASSSSEAVDQMNLSHALNYYGVMQEWQGDLGGAAQSYSRAIEINREWEQRKDTRALVLALSLARLGNVRAAQSAPADCLNLHARSLAIRRWALAADPKSQKEVRGLSLSLDYYGRSLLRLGMYREAASAFIEMLGLEEHLLTFNPMSVETRVHVASARWRLGAAEAAMGNKDGLARIAQGIAELTVLRRTEPAGTRIRRNLIEALRRAASVQRAFGLEDAAEASNQLATRESRDLETLLSSFVKAAGR